MDLSFQEKKAVCKSVTWFKSYNNSSDTGEFRRFFKHPVGVGCCSSSSVGKQSQLLLQPTEVELGLQVGVEFDNIILHCTTPE